MVKRYAERDIEALDDAGGFYISHVMAMTGESLHGKSQIAAELGFRDMKINELESQLAATKADLEALREKVAEVSGHRSELLDLIYQSAIGQVAMGYSVDAEGLAQAAYSITGIDAKST